MKKVNIEKIKTLQEEPYTIQKFIEFSKGSTTLVLSTLAFYIAVLLQVKDSGTIPYRGSLSRTPIPANQIAGFCRALLNGKEVFNTNILPTALSKAGSVKGSISLTKENYSDARDVNNKFEIVIQITYSGMLNEKTNEYETSETLLYDRTTDVFKTNRWLYR